jgi:excisionase family DNA binding protein
MAEEIGPEPAQHAFSIDGFGKCFGIGRTKIYAEIRAGRLRAKKVGRRTLISRDEAHRWWAQLPEARGHD